jgi:hypothetical protein
LAQRGRAPVRRREAGKHAVWKLSPAGGADALHRPPAVVSQRAARGVQHALGLCSPRAYVLRLRAAGAHGKITRPRQRLGYRVRHGAATGGDGRPRRRHAGRRGLALPKGVGEACSVSAGARGSRACWLRVSAAARCGCGAQRRPDEACAAGQSSARHLGHESAQKRHEAARAAPRAPASTAGAPASLTNADRQQQPAA